MITEQTKPPISLPDKPSDLIELALWDLRECEKLPEYFVDMTNWHVGGSYVHTKCSVCLAGAVMARTLDVSPYKTCKPKHFQPDIENKLYALDVFRNGDVADGLVVMMVDDSDRWNDDDVFITPYRDDSDAFHDDMNQLVAALRGVGL